MLPHIEAFEWLNKNSHKFEKYSGKWIAVVKGRMLGFSDSLKGLMAQPKVRNAKHPLITKIPYEEEAASCL